MPDLPISGLTAYTTYHSDDEVEVLDVHDPTFGGTGTNKRLTFSSLISMAGLVSGVAAVGSGGTGLATTGTADQILGVVHTGSGLEYKSLMAGSNITITSAAGAITIAASLPGIIGGTSGQIQYNNGGAFGGFTPSGDATVNTSTGVITVTKTGGVAFATSATTDTTNATNIASGTLAAARLPNPSVSTLGGVQAVVAVSHQWISAISTLGVPALTQPAFTDISGSVAASQLPNPSASTLGGIQSVAAVTNQWINSISTGGVPGLVQPAFTNLSGSIAVSQIPAGIGYYNFTAVKTSNYTAAAGDFVPVDTTSANVTVTLPTAPADKTRIAVKMVIQASSRTVTIAAGGTDVFNKASGSTSMTLSYVLQGIELEYSSSPAIWYVVADDLPQTGIDGRYLQISNNLSDLASVSTARTNLGLVASATTDTTNASNISSGTLGAARLPNPSATTLGGVESYVAVTHQWINAISTAGVPSSTQPAFTDISGSVAASQLPNPSSSTLGGVQSAAAVTNQWINSISTLGVPSLSRPAFTDISGSVAAAQLPNPSATTLGGIQSAAAVSHQWINSISTSGVPALSQPAFTDISGTATVGQLPTTGLAINQHTSLITADTDGATVTFNLATTDWHSVTLGGNRTLALSNEGTNQQFTIVLVQDGTGSRTVTWFSGIKWSAGTAPTLTTTASKADVFTFKQISAGSYYGFVGAQNL